MDLTIAKKKFQELSEQTGILSREKELREPSHSERDELWEISRIFIDRVYDLDIEKNANQEEINTLCHYSIVALHWNDILMSDDRFSFDNGRFRRDTIALALCLFTRVSREYEHYDKLKDGWIMPHTRWSLLIWVTTSIRECKMDNFFNMFTYEQAKEASGFVSDLANAPDGNPVIDIWWEIHRRFNSSRIPYQFVLNYIWNSSALPGGLGLLSNDREMNKAYLSKQIEHKQFPSDWSFYNDLFYVYLFFASKTDGVLDESEIDKMKIKVMEWFGNIDESKKTLRSTEAYNSAKFLFDKDSSRERFSFSLENIRRQFIKEKEGDKNKVSEQLSFILKDLVAIAEADGLVIREEYELVEEIRLNWGIDAKMFDDEIEDIFSNPEIEDVESKPKESIQTSQSEYLEDYPGELYHENRRWDSSEWEGYPMQGIQPFLNVFEDGEFDFEDLFYRFSESEVQNISNKIKSTGLLIYLPFVRNILEKKFDMRGMKSPFWFDPFIISGALNGCGGCFYFEQNGFYQNTLNQDGSWAKPNSINNVAHVDLISELSVRNGYNNYWDNLLDGMDEDIVTTMDLEWYNPNSGNSGFLSFIQTNGPKYSSTLPIVKSIWDNAWSVVVKRSKSAGAFLLGPPPHTKFFNSWKELIDWSESDEGDVSAGQEETVADKDN